MKILTVSGSTRAASTNIRLLKAFEKIDASHQFEHFPNLGTLPLFTTERDENQEVKKWKAALLATDVVIFSTPEYIHNIPAALKSALEWVVASGELANKKVIVITATPHEPRGEKARQSLLWSLNAMDAKILLEFPVYNVPDKVTEEGDVIDEELLEMMKVVFDVISGV